MRGGEAELSWSDVLVVDATFIVQFIHTTMRGFIYQFGHFSYILAARLMNDGQVNCFLITAGISPHGVETLSMRLLHVRCLPKT